MDPDDELRMYPGPKKPSLLHLQSSHRSSIVWDVSGGDAQRSRRRNPGQARSPLHESMIPILQDLQFDGVARLSSINIDWSLITALVERWRSETHTFHLPVGECTITLQDVSILLGLRIDGDVVTGSTGGVEGGWKFLIKQIFGEAPPDEKDKGKAQALKGGRLLLSWLTSICSALPVAPSEEEVRRYTQSYILQLIAGVLFTDHSGGQVHCMYIPLVQDFERCRSLAWGVAVLAYLFRELCKSCRTGVEEIAGCLLLLQLWAWTRLPSLAPVPRVLTLDDPFWGDRAGPYAIRWCSRLRFTDTSAHVLSTHRLSLDALGPNHFIWQPYSNEILAKLPDNWKAGVHIWCYKGPLICFHIVEPHLPDRCMRQFGMIQDIPLDVDFSKKLHDINLQGKQSTNWRSMHNEHILHWSCRQEHVISVGADVGVGVVNGYYKWYHDITRRFHTRIAGSHFYSLDLLDHIAAIAKGEIDRTNEDIVFLCDNGRQVIEASFSHGVFQDFPVEDRRDKEVSKRPKPKKVGHKGGRGGVHTLHKDKVQIDEVPCGPVDDVCDDLGHKGDDCVDDDGCQNLEQHDNVTPTQPSECYPNWNLLPSNDLLRMSNDDVICRHSPEHLVSHELVDYNHSLVLNRLSLSPPTFNLLSQSPPQPELVPEPITQGKNMALSPTQQQQLQQAPSLQQQKLTFVQLLTRHQQQSPHVVQQKEPFVLHQQQSSVAIGQQLPLVPKFPEPQQNQQLPERIHMQLRDRKKRGTKCGTGGTKIPDCKRFRKKY